jgi:3-hydroxyisobutyrate dehydrogenase-like beta-hydroxyacid dehydrogenase
MAERIGFLGPGLMGKGIVKNLLKKGYPVMVYAHRDGLNLSELTQAGATLTRSLQELGQKNTVVCLCVPSSKEVEAAVLGDGGLLANMQPGSVIIDFSTSYPTSTRTLYEKLQAKQVALLDSPMTGTPVHANAGELNLMIGGDTPVFERCRPIYQAVAKNIFHVGPSTHGNIVKLINNFLGQISNAAVAEALPLAMKAGVNIQSLFDVVKVSGGNSRVWEGVVPAVCQRNFTVTFELRLAHKDMGYMSSLGREMNVPLPMVNSLLNVLDLAKATGLGRENTNALVKMYEQVLGVEVRGMDAPKA